MLRQFSSALKITLVFTVLTGLVYPLAVWGLCQGIFFRQANGSLITANGVVAGSTLIGQNFAKPEYFHPRPSAAGNGYDGTASSGSNLGPTNQKLIDRVKTDVVKFRKDNPDYSGAIPADAVTASGSGLDSEISPDNADIQVSRVARSRGVDVDQVRKLVAANTKGRTLGFIGEPRVNVLELNIALDRQFGRR